MLDHVSITVSDYRSDAAQQGFCHDRGPEYGRDSRHSELRVKSNFLSRIKLFLSVQSLAKKYSGFQKPQITLYTASSTPLEGRIAVVTDAGLDAVAAGGASDESVLLADGEVVWS
jgi:hypothetical protein